MSEQKKAIEVYTEASPNPNSLKFVLNMDILFNEAADFPDLESTKNCPLATELFKFNFITRVFISNNYVTISKLEGAEWIEISPIIRAFLKAYLEDNKPVFLQTSSEDKTINDANSISNDDPEIVKKIKSLLTEYVKPAVEMDGGNIVYSSFDENNGKLVVQLQGSCSGCPSSTVTLKQGIENLFKKMIPEVQEVVAENA